MLDEDRRRRDAWLALHLAGLTEEERSCCGRWRRSSTAGQRTVRSTFAALRIRNYRLFVAGSLVSNTGTWMRRVAQDWLVLALTGSAGALGLTTGLQFLPDPAVLPDRRCPRRSLSRSARR